jgi:hypothetical protein
MYAKQGRFDAYANFFIHRKKMEAKKYCFPIMLYSAITKLSPRNHVLKNPAGATISNRLF